MRCCLKIDKYGKKQKATKIKKKRHPAYYIGFCRISMNCILISIRYCDGLFIQTYIDIDRYMRANIHECKRDQVENI